MIYFFDSNTKKYDIFIGSLNGAFITILTATVFYFYEKSRILNIIYTKYSNLYFELMRLDKYLGDFLVSKEITDSKFGINYMITRDISSIAYSFNTEEYSSLFAKNIDNIITRLNNFKKKLNNLNQVTANKAKDVLNYEILQKNIERKRLQGCDEIILAPDIQSSMEYRDYILMSVAKLHEYSVSLKLDLDDLLILLDKSYKFKSKWFQIKEYFNQMDSKNEL